MLLEDSSSKNLSLTPYAIHTHSTECVSYSLPVPTTYAHHFTDSNNVAAFARERKSVPDNDDKAPLCYNADVPFSLWPPLGL